MFVLTADQIDSRNSSDRVGSMLTLLAGQLGQRLALAPDRTAGDELQLLTSHADAALDGLAILARDGHWSVGIGVGAVELPLPDVARAAHGDAFIAARAAVEQAKRSPTRFGLVGGAGLLRDAEVRAIVDLVLTVRARRSAEGWAVVDLLEEGRTQASIADALGISPQAVSLRVSAAGWRLDRSAMPAILRLLDDLDGNDASGSEPVSA